MLNSVERMLYLPTAFYDQYFWNHLVDEHMHSFDLTATREQLGLAKSSKSSNEFGTFIDRQMRHLDSIRTAFLTRYDTDDFLLAEGGDENIPY
jgi:tripartite-type tricarboxylate transporter receptor subunit TctC